MSDDMEFCGTICMAAKKMGIGLREESNGFIWHDPVGAIIKCIPSDSKEKSLILACEQLVNYLNAGS